MMMIRITILALLVPFVNAVTVLNQHANLVVHVQIQNVQKQASSWQIVVQNDQDLYRQKPLQFQSFNDTTMGVATTNFLFDLEPRKLVVDFFETNDQGETYSLARTTVSLEGKRMTTNVFLEGTSRIKPQKRNTMGIFVLFGVFLLTVVYYQLVLPYLERLEQVDDDESVSFVYQEELEEQILQQERDDDSQTTGHELLERPPAVVRREFDDIDRNHPAAYLREFELDGVPHIAYIYQGEMKVRRLEPNHPRARPQDPVHNHREPVIESQEDGSIAREAQQQDQRNRVFRDLPDSATEILNRQATDSRSAHQRQTHARNDFRKEAPKESKRQASENCPKNIIEVIANERTPRQGPEESGLELPRDPSPRKVQGSQSAAPKRTRSSTRTSVQELNFKVPSLPIPQRKATKNPVFRMEPNKSNQTEPSKSSRNSQIRDLPSEHRNEPASQVPDSRLAQPDPLLDTDIAVEMEVPVLEKGSQTTSEMTPKVTFDVPAKRMVTRSQEATKHSKARRHHGPGAKPGELTEKNSKIAARKDSPYIFDAVPENTPRKNLGDTAFRPPYQMDFSLANSHLLPKTSTDEKLAVESSRKGEASDLFPSLSPQQYSSADKSLLGQEDRNDSPYEPEVDFDQDGAFGTIPRIGRNTRSSKPASVAKVKAVDRGPTDKLTSQKGTTATSREHDMNHRATKHALKEVPPDQSQEQDDSYVSTLPPQSDYNSEQDVAEHAAAEAAVARRKEMAESMKKKVSLPDDSLDFDAEDDSFSFHGGGMKARQQTPGVSIFGKLTSPPAIKGQLEVLGNPTPADSFPVNDDEISFQYDTPIQREVTAFTEQAEEKDDSSVIITKVLNMSDVLGIFPDRPPSAGIKGFAEDNTASLNWDPVERKSRKRKTRPRSCRKGQNPSIDLSDENQVAKKPSGKPKKGKSDQVVTKPREQSPSLTVVLSKQVSNIENESPLKKRRVVQVAKTPMGQSTRTESFDDPLQEWTSSSSKKPRAAFGSARKS